MKNYISISVVTLAIALWSCGGKAPEGAPGDNTVIAVKVNQTTTSFHSTYISVSGEIEAAQSAKLSTRIMGHVNSVKVKVADAVQKGDLLLTLNNEDLLSKRGQVNAGIAKAEVALKNAEKDYQRYKVLFEKGSATQKELDDVTTQYQMAKASLEGATQLKKEVDAQFAYTNLRAPFSGVITRLLIDKGDLANPGKTLIELEAPNAFEVTARVHESDMSRITTDSVVQVHVKALKTMVLADITEVSTSASSTGGQFIIKAQLRNTEAPVLSGMYVTVKIPVKSSDRESKVMIPTEALVERGQLSGIYTVSQSNQAMLRWLRLGRIYDGQVEVLSGLSAGESYIYSSQSKLYNGARVSIQ